MTLKVKVNKTFFTWVSECLSRPTDADRTLVVVEDDAALLDDIFRRETSPDCVEDNTDVIEDDDWPENDVGFLFKSVNLI